MNANTSLVCLCPFFVVALWSQGASAWISTASRRSSFPHSRVQQFDIDASQFGYATIVTSLGNENARNFNERLLRDELSVRNSEIPNEAQYAVADGSGLERLNDPDNIATSASGISAPVVMTLERPTSESTMTQPEVPVNGETPSPPVTVSSTPSSSTESSSVVPPAQSKPSISKLQAKMERMVQPRAYPLFLLEKATEVSETLIHDMVVAVTEAGEALAAMNNGDLTTVMAPPELNMQTAAADSKKERIVLLGTGWGAASFLKEIDTDLYDVTVVSPRNHFVFTPMLAGACVGTVEYRSLCEPIREINRNVKFLEATAVNVDPNTQSVTCDAVVCEGNSCVIDSFDVSYDRLIVGVGAQTNTFGIPGVKERCNFLKSVPDARRIKSAIVNCFERANLPHLTDEERIHGLTFAVIGAGPTGIEFAAELRDFVEQDGPKYYPRLLKFVRIKVIEASPTVLAPFDKSLQEEAVKQMQRTMPNPSLRSLFPERIELMELMLESAVSEVGEDIIFLKDGKKVPYGLAVWAAGNGPIPLTLQVIDALGSEQAALQSVGRGRIAIDPWMRALGGNGRLFSLGDCSRVVGVGNDVAVPSANTNLPATAQVASQQGEFLAKLFNKRYELSPERSPEGLFPPPVKVAEQTTPTLSDAIAGLATSNLNGEFAKPFQFLNLGILAYTGGGSALAQVMTLPNAPSVKGSGKLGNAVWRSVYLSKQISWRNRLLVLNDWTNRQLFGRDITRL